MAITILLILIIFYNASRLLSRRIHTIEEAMEKVQEGDLQARIPVGKAKDELGVIAEQFNNMCIKLNDYIKRSFLSEIKLKETELMALQAQINPHFIYNTLEIIRVKAVLQKNHDVGGMILLLSNLFRRSLRCNDVVVSIKDEIDYCKDYLELNGIRFHERMKIEYDIDRSIIEFGVLKLILQPLVENIIVHSVDDNSKLIRIIIKAYRKADDVYIEVIDSGKGIDEGKLQDINEKLDGRQENCGNAHIGLSNVNERLKLVFGNDYGLRICSEKNVFTSVTVRLPAMNIDDMKKLVKSSTSRENILD